MPLLDIIDVFVLLLLLLVYGDHLGHGSLLASVGHYRRFCFVVVVVVGLR